MWFLIVRLGMWFLIVWLEIRFLIVRLEGLWLIVRLEMRFLIVRLEGWWLIVRLEMRFLMVWRWCYSQLLIGLELCWLIGRFRKWGFSFEFDLAFFCWFWDVVVAHWHKCPLPSIFANVAFKRYRSKPFLYPILVTILKELDSHCIENPYILFLVQYWANLAWMFIYAPNHKL